ncbi:MAG: fructose-6-phosphate aldolase [Solirubrobacterales bacterium]
MRIFIDSANMEEIKEIQAMGFVAGVTTNPSLVAGQQGIDFHSRITEITGLVHGPVSAEPFATDYEGIIAEGKQLAAIHPDVVVKVPMTEDGLRAIAEFTRLGISTNATLIFSLNQALLAARAGARYVSVFVGRLDDAGNSGIGILDEIVKALDQYALSTEVIAASIRHPMHVTEAALTGCHIATVPYAVIKAMIKHPLTDLGLARFEADSKKYRGTR